MKLSEVVTIIEEEWENIEGEIKDLPAFAPFKRRVLSLTMQRVKGCFDPTIASELVSLAYGRLYQ